MDWYFVGKTPKLFVEILGAAKLYTCLELLMQDYPTPDDLVSVY